jgi:hypothetical protein
MDDKDYTAPAIVFAFIVTMIIVKTLDASFPLKDLVAAMATLIAAFVGAQAAFSMQKNKAKEDEIQKQCATVNQTIYLLGLMWSNFKGYTTQSITPSLSSPAPWLAMKHRIVGSEVKLPHEGLLFLLNSQKNANFYLELLHLERCYNTTCDIINVLHQTHTEELQPKLESLGYSRLGMINTTIIEPQLGPVLAAKLQTLTNDAFTDVPKIMDSIRALNSKFRTAMAEDFQSNLIPNLELI